MHNSVESKEGDGCRTQLFCHSNGGGDFQSRVDSVFGSLGSLEKKYEDNLPAEENIYVQDFPTGDIQPSDFEFLKPSSVTRVPKFKSKRSIEGPQTVPGHIINPEKWVKYSLADDGSAGTSHGLTSDEVNSKIAEDFMSDIRKRKIDTNDPHTSESDAQIEEVPSKIVYKSPAIKHQLAEKKAVNAADKDKPSHVMDHENIGDDRHCRLPEISDGYSKSLHEVSLDYLCAVEEESALASVDISELPKTKEESFPNQESNLECATTFKKRKNRPTLMRKRECDAEDDSEI